MDGASIQSKIARGYGIAATHLGDVYSWYRPKEWTSPLDGENLQGTLSAQFATDPQFQFRKPNSYGNAIWYGMLDSTNLQSGDYLVGPLGTFFVTDVERFASVQAVQCNRTVSVKRPPQPTMPGLNPYGGDTEAGETDVMTAWPCSILMTRRGTEGEAKLPGDTRDPWMIVLIPYLQCYPILSRDIIVDEAGSRYVVSAAELTNQGWRIEAQQVMT